VTEVSNPGRRPYAFRVNRGQRGRSSPKARSTRQHTLALVLIPCAVAVGAVAFVVVLVHLPQITGGAIPIFLGIELVVVGALAGFTGYRSGRNRPDSQVTVRRQRRATVALQALGAVALTVFLATNWNAGVLANLGVTAVAVAILIGLAVLVGVAFMNGDIL
jgi:hypothetical protein